MTKLNLNNGTEIKSGIYPWDIFKSDTISFLPKYIEVFQRLSKSQFLNFMTKVNPKNGNETKSDTFPRNIFESDTFFHQNILKYFNDFQNRNFSILWIKWTQKMEMKQNKIFFHGTYSNLTAYLSLVIIY